MDSNPAQLNQKQVDVLRWIRDGCASGVYENGYEHRIIARALERRGLLTITGRGPTWAAEVTEAGRAWDGSPSEVAQAISEADLLIEKVLEAGGCMPLASEREAEKTYGRLARMSLKSPNRPKGKKLEIRRTGGWSDRTCQITFVEHFDDYVERVAVPVPEHVSKFHPAVKGFLENNHRQYVTKEHLPRAARILQAIAVEAAKRGIEVRGSPDARRRPDRYQRAAELVRAHLLLQTQAGLYAVQIREISGPGATKIEPRYRREHRSGPAWIEDRGWEFISTGKLELVVNGEGVRYKGDHYRDAKTITVEAKLPDVFRSFEIYRLRAEWQERDRRREKVERQGQWEAAMEQAKARFAEHVRWVHFMERSQEWRAAGHHREFLAAARSVVNGIDGDLRAVLAAELDFAERTLDSLDGLKQPELLVPEVPDPSADDLRPFLGGWSPHGPDDRHW